MEEWEQIRSQCPSPPSEQKAAEQIDREQTMGLAGQPAITAGVSVRDAPIPAKPLLRWVIPTPAR